MTTLGDVLFVFGGFAATAFTLWGLLMLVGLLYRQPTAVAARELEHRGGFHVGAGLLLMVPVTVLELVLLNVPAPPVKVLALVVVGLQLSVSVIGLAGLSRLTGEKVQALGGSDNVYGGMAKGAALICIAGLIPLVGWLVLTPIIAAASLSAGVRALRPVKPSRAPEPGEAA